MLGTMIFLFAIMLASGATYFGICFFRFCLAINNDNIRFSKITPTIIYFFFRIFKKVEEMKLCEIIPDDWKFLERVTNPSFL